MHRCCRGRHRRPSQPRGGRAGAAPTWRAGRRWCCGTGAAATAGPTHSGSGGQQAGLSPLWPPFRQRGTTVRLLLVGRWAGGRGLVVRVQLGWLLVGWWAPGQPEPGTDMLAASLAHQVAQLHPAAVGSHHPCVCEGLRVLRVLLQTLAAGTVGCSAGPRWPAPPHCCCGLWPCRQRHHGWGQPSGLRLASPVATSRLAGSGGQMPEPPHLPGWRPHCPTWAWQLGHAAWSAWTLHPALCYQCRHHRGLARWQQEADGLRAQVRRHQGWRGVARTRCCQEDQASASGWPGAAALAAAPWWGRRALADRQTAAPRLAAGHAACRRARPARAGCPDRQGPAACW